MELEILQKRSGLNKELLQRAGLQFLIHRGDLLASEDQLLDILDLFEESITPSATIVLDITSLPKRYFCFFLKLMMNNSELKNIVVTYTEPGLNGYTTDHLAEDPMSGDHLPGYAAPPPGDKTTFVISMGFESLSIKPLLQIYGGERKKIKMLFAYPPNGENNKRQWNTLRQVVTDTQDIQGNTEVIAAWDAEQVYKTLAQWAEDSDGLTLAPFGPKPHSLGMALFALQYDVGLYYTQPKSYNPSYSSGTGGTWAYVVKWEGTPCFKRYAYKP